METTTPRKRRDISGEGLDPAPSPTKRPSTGLAPIPNLPIRSWVTHRDNVSTAVVDGLSADKLQMYQLLKAYRDSLDMNAPTAATWKFNIQERARAVAAMASLYMPMDEMLWQPWKRQLDALMPLQGVAERYCHSHSHFTEKLVATCELFYICL